MSLNEFLKQFGIKEEIQTKTINRMLFRNPQLLEQRPVYSGEIIAHQRGPALIPSIDFLQHIGKQSRKHVIVDSKAEWMYICGRDLFGTSITKHNNPAKNDFVAVLNQHGECIGYGQMIGEAGSKKVAVKRLFDIGDLLRRERKQKKVRF